MIADIKIQCYKRPTIIMRGYLSLNLTEIIAMGTLLIVRKERLLVERNDVWRRFFAPCRLVQLSAVGHN